MAKSMNIWYYIAGAGMIALLITKQAVYTPVKLTIESKLAFLKRMKQVVEYVQLKYSIQSTITIAQSALESAWGTSQLAIQANNLFGIKATNAWINAGKPTWSGKTTEYSDYTPYSTTASFRKYASYLDSAKDWANLISGADIYSDAYQEAVYGNVSSYGQAVQKAGYATDPLYANKLVAFDKEAHTLNA